MKQILRYLLLIVILAFPIAAQAENGNYSIHLYLTADSAEPAKVVDGVYGQAVTLSKSWFFNPDRAVALWSTDPEGDGENYLPGDTLVVDEPLEGDILRLYASFSPRMYHIRFLSNGGSGTMSRIKDILYSEEVNLPACTMNRTGCTFAGWNTKKDGSGTAYADGATVCSLTKTHNKTVTLYAQWKEVNYTIRFMPNNGVGEVAPIKKVAYSDTVTLPENGFSRAGYTFAGWSTDKSGSKSKIYQPGDQVQKLASQQGTIVKLYARWSPSPYTISFKGNGSTSGSTESISTKTGKTVTLTDCGFVRTGYIFTGWNTAKDGSGTAYDNGVKVKSICPAGKTKVTLYAQWIPGVKQRDYASVKWFHKGKTVRSSGCGICCLSMVLSRYNYRFITPKELVAYGKSKGGCSAEYCTVDSLNAFYLYSKAFGCKVILKGSGPSGSGSVSSASKKIKAALKAGYMVIGQMTKSGWTAQGHYVTFCGVNKDGKTYVYTSADVDGSKYYKYESGYYSDKIAFGALANYFIIGPK